MTCVTSPCVTSARKSLHDNARDARNISHKITRNQQHPQRNASFINHNAARHIRYHVCNQDITRGSSVENQRVFSPLSPSPLLSPPAVLSLWSIICKPSYGNVLFGSLVLPSISFFFEEQDHDGPSCSGIISFVRSLPHKDASDPFFFLPFQLLSIPPLPFLFSFYISNQMFCSPRFVKLFLGYQFSFFEFPLPGINN